MKKLTNDSVPLCLFITDLVELTEIHDEVLREVDRIHG